MSTKDQVQLAYIAYYGRLADPAGLEYWSSMLADAGGSIGTIIDAFGNSAESQALYSGDSNQAKVTKVYQQLFERDPDAAGLAYYANQLEQGAITLQSFALDVLNGAQGDDKALIDKKKEVADLVTDLLDKQGTGYTYKGNDDAQAARNLLGQVTLQTDASAFSSDAQGFIDTIYDNNWITLGGSYAGYNATLEGNGESFFHVTSKNTSSGPGLGYNSEIFVALVDNEFNVTKQAFIGDADRQSPEAAALTADEGIVIAGAETRSMGFITRLDSDLNVKGTVSVGNGDGTVALNDIASDSNGKMIAVGHQNAEADAQDAYIVSLNADMSVHAERRIDDMQVANSNESLDQVMVLKDNSILTWSDDRILKFDEDLRLEKALDSNFDFYDIVQLDDGNLLAQTYGTTDLVLLDQSLQVLNAWAAPGAGIDDLAINDSGQMMAIWRGSLDGHRGSIVTYDADEFTGANQEIQSTDFKYITDRNGYSESPNNVIANGENFILQDRGELFTIKPNHETSPNLASDYRLHEQELDVTLNSVESTNSYYPNSSQMTWGVADVSLIGVANYDSIQVNGGMSVVINNTI